MNDTVQPDNADHAQPDIDQAKINFDWGGQNYDYPGFVRYASTPGEVLAWVTEAIRNGFAGFTADPRADLTGFQVDHRGPTEQRPFNLIQVRPKTSFGATLENISDTIEFVTSHGDGQDERDRFLVYGLTQSQINARFKGADERERALVTELTPVESPFPIISEETIARFQRRFFRYTSLVDPAWTTRAMSLALREATAKGIQLDAFRQMLALFANYLDASSLTGFDIIRSVTNSRRLAPPEAQEGAQ